jgi:hypothetical protein
MTPRDAKTELLEARQKLEQMYVEKDEIEVRIAKQKRIVAALTELADVGEDSGPPEGLVKGITDACKTAVIGATKPLYPSEVRDRIKALGFPDQQNLLASVHTVLKRLDQAGEIKLTEDGTYRRMTLGERIGRTPNAGDFKRELDPKRLVDQMKEFQPTYNHPDPLGKRGKK